MEALSQQPDQCASDRPDIVARVFRLKLKELTRDFKEKNLFGKVIAGMFLPQLFIVHIHITIYSITQVCHFSYSQIYMFLNSKSEAYRMLIFCLL